MTGCVAVMTKCDNNSITFSLLCDNHRNVHISLSPTTEYLSDATSLIRMLHHGGNGGNGAYLMYENTSAGVGVGGVLLSGPFCMCPTAECVLCSENVYTAHCMK